MKALKTISDLIKNLKYKKPAPKICPVCDSPRLKLSSSFDTWLTPTIYVCLDCGYRGPIVVELEKTKEENGE